MDLSFYVNTIILTEKEDDGEEESHGHKRKRKKSKSPNQEDTGILLKLWKLTHLIINL